MIDTVNSIDDIRGVLEGNSNYRKASSWILGVDNNDKPIFIFLSDRVDSKESLNRHFSIVGNIRLTYYYTDNDGLYIFKIAHNDFIHAGFKEVIENQSSVWDFFVLQPYLRGDRHNEILSKVNLLKCLPFLRGMDVEV